MNQSSSNAPVDKSRSLCWAGCFALLIAPTFAGCATSRSTCSCANCDSARHCDFPPAAIPAPNGTFAREIQRAQVSKAAEDELVIYQHEWTSGGTVLGPRAERHMKQIAQRVTVEPNPVVVETSLDAQLDATRRQAIVDRLATLTGLDVDSRVIIGDSKAEGLSADDVQQLMQNRARGEPSGGLRGITPFGGFQGGFRGSMGGGYNAF